MTMPKSEPDKAKAVVDEWLKWAKRSPVLKVSIHVCEELELMIAEALKQAREEGYLKGLQAHPCCCDSKEECDHEDAGREQGFREGVEACVKVCGGAQDPYGYVHAIRKLLPKPREK